MSHRGASLQVGIGKSSNRSSKDAGREAARAALNSLQSATPGLILVFGTGGYQHQTLLEAIQHEVGRTPISGCSASGIITKDGLDENTHAVGVMALASNCLQFDAFQVEGVGNDSADSGKRLGQAIREKSQKKHGLLLVFPDGIHTCVTDFLDALHTELPSGIVAAGGTSGELLKLDRSYEYHGARAVSDSVSAVLVTGDFDFDIAATHGCDPIGQERVVTRADNGWIYELDGEPAWSAYKKFLDLREDQRFSMGESCFVCLAETLPEPDPRYGEYIIRCPLQLDRDHGALFFPGDIKTGTKVRMALRNSEKTVRRAIQSAEEIVARHRGVRPDLVFQFDCCCRGQLLFGAEANKLAVAPLRETFGTDIPWFGFSTYGEIAPLPGGRALFHNYTTVLCAIYPRS